MVLESAQLLSTYLHINNRVIDDIVLPKPTHMKHPCQVWLNESPANTRWLCIHFIALLDEYTFRYNKAHSYEKYRNIFSFIFIKGNINHTPFKQCMPEEYKDKDSVKAYKSYYDSKQHTMKRKMIWTKREIPNWFNFNKELVLS